MEEPYQAQPGIETERGTKCPCCGASMKAYWHNLSPLLVNNLERMRDEVRDLGKNDVEIANIPYLSKISYNNFQKLRLHGLIAKVKKNGEHVWGHWLITKRGFQFLNGEIVVPKMVQTFRNRVIDHSKELTSYENVMKMAPTVERTFDYTIMDIERTSNGDWYNNGL